LIWLNRILDGTIINKLPNLRETQLEST